MKSNRIHSSGKLFYLFFYFNNIYFSRASVLYDKPTDQFHIPTIEEKHQILMKMNAKYSYKQFQGKSNTSSRFTSENERNNVVYVQDRPAILVSSTSWSEDENFALLFDALKSMFRIRCYRQIQSLTFLFSIWFS
jgi:hypothetical protein